VAEQSACGELALVMRQAPSVQESDRYHDSSKKRTITHHIVRRLELDAYLIKP
jgi:hypothetical protein